MFAQETGLRSATKPQSETMLASSQVQQIPNEVVFLKILLIFRPSLKKRCKLYRIPMQLIKSRRPALFPSRNCYIKLRKIDKNTHPPKVTRSGKQLFFRIRLISPNRMYGVIPGIKFTRLGFENAC